MHPGPASMELWHLPVCVCMIRSCLNPSQHIFARQDGHGGWFYFGYHAPAPRKSPGRDSLVAVTHLAREAEPSCPGAGVGCKHSVGFFGYHSVDDYS